MPRAAGLADQIQEALGITPELIPGSNGVYDIVADGKTIFSKGRSRQFPDPDSIITLLKKPTV